MFAYFVFNTGYDAAVTGGPRFVGGIASLDDLSARVGKIVCLEEDDQNPGYFDCATVHGDIYSIEPAKPYFGA